MGCSQGKQEKKSTLQEEKDVSNEFKTISEYEYKNVKCYVIEFQSDTVSLDCEISLTKLKLLENYSSERIFQSIIDSFDIINIFLPKILFLNFENDRVNIFLKLVDISHVLEITNKFIGLIKNFSRMLKFTQDFSYKLMKRIESDININPLDNLNQSNKKKVRIISEETEVSNRSSSYDQTEKNRNYLDCLIDSMNEKATNKNKIIPIYMNMPQNFYKKFSF